LSEFKSALERLKGCEDGKTSSRLDEEFEVRLQTFLSPSRGGFPC